MPLVHRISYGILGSYIKPQRRETGFVTLAEWSQGCENLELDRQAGVGQRIAEDNLSVGNRECQPIRWGTITGTYGVIFTKR